MKCPFRKIVTTVPDCTNCNYVGTASALSHKQIEDFAECYKFECPYYDGAYERCNKIYKECNADKVEKTAVPIY